MPERIPTAVAGIQVNFCKNPVCPNFGVLPIAHSGSGPGAGKTRRDNYAISDARPDYPFLHCHGCGENPPLKSNLAVSEERVRLLAVLKPRAAASCPNPRCANHGIPVSTGTAHYVSFGRTHSGSKRLRCKQCQRVFAVGAPTRGQRAPHKNKTVFALLMNKSPFRRICEVADITPPTLYGKISWLHGQCLAFAAEREQALLNGMTIPRLYLGTDRQDYVVNWTRQEDRRNVVLHAVGSADNATGYVLGMHLNYDPGLVAAAVERAAALLGDPAKRQPWRQHARVWLKADYDAATKRRQARRTDSGQDLKAGIETAYEEAVERPDVEVSEVLGRGRRLPTHGMQVHAEYSLYGHFFFLKHLTAGAEKIRFFLDQDSGMRAACLAAFEPDIKARRADAFYVRINKEMTVNQKRASLAVAKAKFDEARKSHPTLAEFEVETMLIQERLRSMMELGKWKDRWLIHPLPDMGEPEKAVCYLTDYRDYDQDHLARLYGKASLHAIDRFFMQVRRRLSLLERPIQSSSARGRTWFGYSAYNPEVIVKLLGIFRVFYNYCLAGEDKKTPAMRLGLAKGKVSLEDIIYY